MLLNKSSQQVSLWCGLWSIGIIEPYFFENEYSCAVTINGIYYCEMIIAFLWPQLKTMDFRFDVDEMFLHQNGTTCHVACKTIKLLQQKFHGQMISWKSDHNWPPGSCNLTPCDFYLWGFIKSKVYSKRILTIPEFKDVLLQQLSHMSAKMWLQILSEDCASAIWDMEDIFHNYILFP